MALLQVRSVWTGGTGSPYYSNFYFGDGAILTDVADAVTDFFEAACVVVSSSTRVTVDPTVVVVDETTGHPIGYQTGVFGAAIVGSDPQEPLASQTQGLLSLRTEEVAGTRRLQGKFYCPLPCEDRSASGFPDNTYRSGLAAAGAVILAYNENANNDSAWKVWSRKYGKSAIITSCLSEAMWATLRTRGARG